jgi:hypothetical protein
MIKEADASCALAACDEATDKKRGALRLVSSRPAASADDDATTAEAAATLPRPLLYPAFLVRDERFAALHPREVFSRLRRRGSYVFHC